MDTSKIGNARQQDDNRIATANAKGLGECWQELCVTFEQADLQSSDYQAEQMATYRSMQAEPDTPEAQAWIKSCIMADKATDKMRQAIANGDLPIWRIHDAREVVLAPAFLDRDNVRHGIFKSYERPEPDMQGAKLWAKLADWEAFVSMARPLPNASVTALAGQGAVVDATSDEFSDTGWIKGLPPGWIDGLICARRLYRRFKSSLANVDPAPWHEVINAEYWGPYGGDTPEEYAVRQKLTARLVATFQRAIFANELSPAFFDGSAFHEIPAAAFLRDKVVEGGLRDGGLELDPLWPDDWQLWGNHGWAIPKTQFQEWLASDRALSPEALPPSPARFGVSSIPLITHRQPSASGRVPLSEAVTWIAFGISLNAERLSRALRWQSMAGGDLELAQRMIEDAAHSLLCAGSDKHVSFYGRHLQHRNDRGQRMEAIDPLALDDYRQLLIVGDNALHYGEGLAMRYRAINDAILETSVRSDYFNNVTVDRAELLKFFPATLDSMQALTMPLPALLPGIGAVIGLEEAVCWLAYGRPSHDTAVYADCDGNLVFRDPDGIEVPNVLVGEMPAHLVAFIGAIKAIWAALQDGTLRGLVAPAEGAALTIPRVYWTSINPECLEYLYHGTASSDAGRGCPVLLSRQAFDDWRAMLPQSAKLDKGVNVKTARKRPGPAPDPDWPHAIAKVTQDCIAAGYKRRRKRGDKAAIQTMLLNFMAAKDKHFSDDIAAKHAETVIAALPDN